MQIRQRRRQIKDTGKRALLLRHPRHSLHADGMQGEDKPGQPRSAQSQQSDNRDDETSGEAVFKKIGEVITQNSIAPEAMLDPERGMQQRIILMRGSQLKPDAPQAMKRLQRR